MGDSAMQIKIPEDLITNTIKAELVKAVIAGGKGEAWIEAIVRAAISEKVNSYDRTTKFEAAVSEMIRQEATNLFAEWLKENREKIRKALETQLKRNNNKIITDLVAQLTSELTYIHPSVSLGLKREEE